MNIKNLVLDYIRYKQINWYAHVRRMNEESLCKKILKWHLPGRRRKLRPRNSWIQEVTTGMREKRINSMELIDREELRRKLKL